MSDWWVHSYVQAGLVIHLVSWIFWVVLSVTLHELGHGWAALWQGDDTPRRLGHMTANPLVHMGWPSLLMLALCGIAWGAMPVDPSRFRDRHRGDLYVSAAGPAVNLALAAICLVLIVAWMKLVSPDAPAYRNIAVFLYFGFALNIILAPFNLLPIPPLDGSRILASLSWKARQLFSHPNAQTVGLVVFLLIFFISPLGGMFFSAAWGLSESAVDLAGGLVGNEPIGPLLAP